jgi:hypothetical protein
MLSGIVRFFKNIVKREKTRRRRLLAARRPIYRKHLFSRGAARLFILYSSSEKVSRGLSETY